MTTIGLLSVNQHPLVEAKNIVRKVDGRTLLNSVSVSLAPGDRIGLVGAMGSGKSLLLRSLAMLEPWNSGELRWRQAPISHREATAYRSRVIYLHQQPPKFEGSVESVLRMPFELQVHRDKRFDRRGLVKRLETIGRGEQFLSQRHQQLSGGESQIVAMLRAIQLSPQVLLLDEPTAALDEQSTDRVEQIVQQWYDEASQSRALVWVSHDPRQSARVSDRVLKMNNGQLGNTETGT